MTEEVEQAISENDYSNALIGLAILVDIHLLLEFTVHPGILSSNHSFFYPYLYYLVH